MCGIYGFSTKCSLDKKNAILNKIGIENIKRGPNISKHIFQQVSGGFTVTATGQIYTSNKSPVPTSVK